MLFRIYEALKPENFWNWSLNPFDSGMGYLLWLGAAFLIGAALRSRRK